MADVFTPEKRSAVMARIRSKDTKPELAVRRALYAMGVRYRLHDRTLPGKPDIVMRKRRLAIQVRGCFWHGHRCLKGRRPGQNQDYWGPKIAGNIARDRRNDRRLRAQGWRVRVVWECAVRRWPPNRLAVHLARFIADPREAEAPPSAASGT